MSDGERLPVCAHCGQQYDTRPAVHGPRGIIGLIASQLIKWADESRDDGWSTHQVKPMQELAAKLSTYLVTGKWP